MSDNCKYSDILINNEVSLVLLTLVTGVGVTIYGMLFHVNKNNKQIRNNLIFYTVMCAVAVLFLILNFVFKNDTNNLYNITSSLFRFSSMIAIVIVFTLFTKNELLKKKKEIECQPCKNETAPATAPAH